MRLYNTLSKRLEELKPIKPPVVTIYTCGPTVYDFPHIGNWFTYIRWDILVRTLQQSGFAPQWVVNITDVGHLVSDADDGEDKLEKGARRDHKTAWDVAAYYGEYFVDGLKRLNFRMPDHLPKATEHVAEQIDLVKKLEAKGFTYTTSDGVYYDTSKFPKYADFAQLDLDEQQAGARVEYDPEKRNPSDFALWKFSPKDRQRDMEWDSPWGRGFPGWHIECSAMSMKYLGETLDIHAGGIEHIPVHHTNEIAQSEPVTGKPLAHIWLHGNHITTGGEKISKSLGNVYTLEDIESHGVSLEAFRLHVLESHYRSQSKFSWESLEAAQNRLRGYQEAAALLHQGRKQAGIGRQAFETAAAELSSCLEDDLNTPAALARLSGFMDEVKAQLLSSDDVDAFRVFLEHVDQLLGLQLATQPDLPGDQLEMIKRRDAARGAKDWGQSDQLRDQLAGQGIGVRDTPSGTIWYRV